MSDQKAVVENEKVVDHFEHDLWSFLVYEVTKLGAPVFVWLDNNCSE